MNFCTIHQNKPYEYICKSRMCDLPILCSDCRKNHLLSSKDDHYTHAAQIVTIKYAMQEAYSNINTNLKTLQLLRTPSKNQDQIKFKISQQIRQLNQDRNRILSIVNEVFDKQIEMITRANNRSAFNGNSDLFQKIQTKIKNLETARANIKSDFKVLKDMLKYNDSKFIDEMRKVNTFSSMNLDINQYFIYDKTKHDFIISRHQLKRKPVQQRLLQKVYNQSDLYFLIDNYYQGHFLHYFTQGDNLLRLYNLKVGTWSQKKFIEPEMPNYGTTLYQHHSKRFYLIGGQIRGRKSQNIYWFQPREGWKKHTSLITGRSSAMATIVYDKKNPKKHYILIAGGIGDQRKNLKSCQLFYSENNTCYQVASMNFAVVSGTLVTFNDTTVLRIGGLGEFQSNVASICEAPQKYDLANVITTLSTSPSPISSSILDQEAKFNWAYLDLEIVNTDPTKKFNLYYANQAAIQINPNEIFVFGGITHSNIGVNQSYIIEVQTITNKFNRTSTRYYVRWINQKPLISPEGFLGLRPIIFDKKVMSLQNITVKYSPNEIYEQEKRLIEFNMYQWKQIENIVPF